MKLLIFLWVLTAVSCQEDLMTASPDVDCSCSNLTMNVKDHLAMFGPFSIKNDDSLRTKVTFFPTDKLKSIEECSSSLKVRTDVSFKIQRDDSTSLSTITYWRPDTQKIETFNFDKGYSDHTSLEYNGEILICSGNGGKTTKCNQLIEGKAVNAIVLSADFNPRSGNALRNQWSRNKYSLYGSFYDAKCSTMFGPVSIKNEDSFRTKITFFPTDQLKSIQECPSSLVNLEVNTDVSFKIQRDDSTSLSTITYWRPDTQKIETFNFDKGFSDHTSLEYNGETLMCSGNGGKTTKCNHLIEGKAVKAVVLSADFNPRSGNALRNQWSRNKYSLFGSFYDVKCSRREIGRCLTKIGEKYWCYVSSNSKCSDKKQLQSNDDLYWSYKACENERAKVIDFEVELPSITGNQKYIIDLELWDIPNNRKDPIKTTENLQKAIDWAHNQVYSKVHLPVGHYLVGIVSPLKYQIVGNIDEQDRHNISMTGIELHSNTEFILDKDATLEMVTNDKPIYCVICIKDATDVIIRGGTIKGDRDTHIFANHSKKTTHEWGHGVVIMNEVHRISVRDMELKDFTGDGVYLGTGWDYKINGSDITVAKNNIYNNRRQGVSVVGGLRVNIEDNEIHHIKGIAPQFGVDIEGPGSLTKDIIITNNNFHNNRGGDVANTNGENVFITENVMVQSHSYNYTDGPIVTWHKTDQVIAHNNMTMFNESKNGQLGYIQYSNRKNENPEPKGHNRVTYVHDNYCQGCGMYMYNSSDADIRRNKFLGHFLGLGDFHNAVILGNHVEVPLNKDICNWSYRIFNTTGQAAGNTYSTHSQPQNIKPYEVPLSDQPWTRDCQ